MSFKELFTQWLNASLSQSLPNTVKAFSFNLYEYAETPEYKFGVELVGTGSFDANDPDWACDEVWEPTTRRIEIPKQFSGANWEECLVKTESLVSSYLNDEKLAQILKSSSGVGIGFVDGDLKVIWQQQDTNQHI